MTPRVYQMDARAAERARTRERILEAAVGLHTRRGILGTTYRQIAEAADVSVGTVYNHFPSLDDLVPACSALLMGRLDPPTPDAAEQIVAGSTSVRARLNSVGRELFSFYERGGAHLHVHPSERELPDILEWEAYQRDTVSVYVRTAVKGRRVPVGTLRAVTALFDLPTYEALRARGVTAKGALDSSVRAATSLLGSR